MAQRCRENVVCLALAAATTPHCTTIAALVASLWAERTMICRHIVLVGAEAGRMGRAMGASAGVQLPWQARKAWSGPKTDRQQ